jgi:hypothetical protein
MAILVVVSGGAGPGFSARTPLPRPIELSEHDRVTIGTRLQIDRLNLQIEQMSRVQRVEFPIP